MHDDGAREGGGLQARIRMSITNTAGFHFYWKLKKIGFENRPLDLQVLCWNCQWGKRLNNGFCPHHPEINLRETSE